MLFKCGLLGIADVYCSTHFGGGVPLYRSLELFTHAVYTGPCSDSLFTSLQCYVAWTEFLQTTNPSPIYFWQPSDSLWKISTQLKFSGKPVIRVINLVDKRNLLVWLIHLCQAEVTWNSLKILYITNTVIPCSLQSIATLQNTILIARYLQEKYSGDPSSASENKKMSHL